MLTVFGSINLDIAIRVARLPLPGETLLGSQAQVSPGGKGANQAHAACLFGAATRLIGAVGRDAFADAALQQLREAGVDLSGVRRLDDAATGLATIAVAGDGENSIIVAPGANGRVQADWVSPQQLGETRMLLLQMEVPVEQSMQLARRAREAGCHVVLNGAPMAEPRAIDASAVDSLIVNETELAQLCDAWHGLGVRPAEQAAWFAQHWRIRIVVTLGADGAHCVDAMGRHVTCGALPGTIVDTTGAGDTFTGVFAAALAGGHHEDEALRHAVVAAGLACRRAGAQAAQPRRAEIDAGVREHDLRSPPR